MNLSLTLAAEYVGSRFGRLITQAQAWLARASPAVSTVARAAFTQARRFMDHTQRVLMDRIYARRMDVRRVFLANPYSPNSEFTPAGRRILAHWARHAHALAPVQTNDAMTMAKAEGKRELFGLILADLFDDLPDFARLMAQEEAKLREEIVA